MASSHRQDLLHITRRAPGRLVLPALAVAAALSGAVLYATVRALAFAGGCAAAVIAGAFLIWYARRLFPPADVSDQAVVTDWSVARAAAQATGSAVAITDRNGRLICASCQFGEWFPGYPTPPQLKLAGPDVERLTAAGRAAWRDGEARVEGLARGALLLDADIIRTG